jgi:hypothetical protein
MTSINDLLAHFSVFVDDLLAQPIVELEKIVSFIGYPVDRPAIVSNILEFLQQLQTELGLPNHVLSTVTAISAASGSGKLSTADEQLLTTVDSALVASALNALEDELTNSNTLADWPCKTFRDLDKLATNKNGKLLALPMTTKDVAADCSAPHVKCTIRYDLAGG